ncbi:response regulator [Chitinophaga nivalis]|uniref:Response regulator transcription factor n=1 Tax=Chitinophaga nivalis TaxID=2991709 RepID=A0ABT3IJU6_9BACT|nr:response regulator transcription factor [Chitinophaga nivalis]MCW3466090.1 response regulator transcription factor [Chitinophaga nivalis]MCW3484219.1 response regulator transcription factor [Chitinophaga nivalis]
MSIKPIKLLIVDEHALFRKILKKYLSAQPNINVLIDAPNIQEAIRKFHSAEVEELVIDVFAAAEDPKDTLDSIREVFPHIKIVVLSMCRDVSSISDLIDLGINAYVSKMDEPEELLQVIVGVSEGHIYPHRLFTEALYLNQQRSRQAYAGNIHVALTERERKVLQLLWEEKSNKEIADQIFLGVRSIEKIRQDLKEKLGVKSTVGLLKYAIDQKIIG